MTGANGLAHQALVYDSPADLAAAVLPLLREGMERGDKLFVAARRANVDALLDALGADADRVELHDTERWAARPADRLAAVRRMVDAVPADSRVLAFGEPVWSGSPAVRREWARYESVINRALADAPLRFVCLYDRSALSDDVLGHGLCTHGEVLERGTIRPSADYCPPELFVPSLKADRASVHDDAHEIEFDGDHGAFRRALAALALERGVDPDRVEEFVIAASEVSTNAVLHGALPVHARAWAADGEFVCEVSDSGGGIGDPLAGWGLPAAGATGGWGLPLTRRLCDALEIVPRADGTSVYLHVTLCDGR
jgi:anti-sigma regulatory factor (Ser/Thr protein kinase)